MKRKITRTMKGTYYVFNHNEYPDVKGFNLTADEVLNLLADGYTLKKQTKGEFKLSMDEDKFIAMADIEVPSKQKLEL